MPPRSTPPPRLPLETHALAVTRRLLSHGPMSRGLLGRDLQLSDASVSRVARSLVRDGLVTEDLDEITGVGRPRQLLSAVPSARHVVGVKMTGSRAYGVACNLLGEVEAGAEAALAPPVDGEVPVMPTVDALVLLVDELRRGLPSLDGVAVSVGGVVADRTVVRDGPFLGWRDVDLGALLGDRLGVGVVVSNDVVALARQQLWFGAGRGHGTFGVLTIGAGIGFAVVREGVVLDQLIDNGHLLGHAPLDLSGPPCGLGHAGCVSAYLDPTAVERRLPPRDGRPDTFAEAIRDPGSAPVADDAARALGHLVATVAGALQTDRIVLAGEDVEPLFGSPVLAATIDGRLDAGRAGTRADPWALDVSTAPLDFSAWARGAAVTGIQSVLGAL